MKLVRGVEIWIGGYEYDENARSEEGRLQHPCEFSPTLDMRQMREKVEFLYIYILMTLLCNSGQLFRVRNIWKFIIVGAVGDLMGSWLMIRRCAVTFFQWSSQF